MDGGTSLARAAATSKSDVICAFVLEERWAFTSAFETFRWSEARLVSLYVEIVVRQLLNDIACPHLIRLPVVVHENVKVADLPSGLASSVHYGHEWALRIVGRGDTIPLLIGVAIFIPLLASCTLSASPKLYSN